MHSQSKSKNSVQRLILVALISSLFAIIFCIIDFSHIFQKIFSFMGELTQIKTLSNLSLFLPLIISLLIVHLTMILSPQQKKWSRTILIFTSLFFLIRYFTWRIFSTLNFQNPLNTFFSISLLIIEIIFIISPFLQTILTLKINSRTPKANQLSVPVINGIYQPTVDILIPSYNEPLALVKRTIVACQAIEYKQKKVYLLDDGNREEIKQLCQQLNCGYITRENNLHAKAGNLNNALKQTKGEIIVVFDADFIPTTNFLIRTLGFFQDKSIGLLQTYQSFYSHDPIAKNLGLETKIPTEVEIFSRYYQLIRDSLNTALCYGSSFLVRRNYLTKIGGFVTGSLSEDYHTGIRLASEGYQVIYLDESLSAGLSAENCFGHIRQRKRWARGTIQSLFIPENPLFIKGFNIWQRIAHLEGILQWFLSPLRVILLLLPLAYNLLHITPLKAEAGEIIYFFFPFYFVQMSVFSWLNFRSRSALISEVYNVVTAVPLSLEIIQTLINPFQSIFKVTPKGIKHDDYYFNWGLASPLIFFLVINFFNLFNILESINNNFTFSETVGLNVLLFWNLYNIIIIALSIIVLIEVPKKDIYQWLNVDYNVKLKSATKQCQGRVVKMSEIGAEILLIEPNFNHGRGEIEFITYGINLNWEKVYFSPKTKTLKVQFQDLSLMEYRAIIKILFCQPNCWKKMQTPGELKSLWLLISALFITVFKLIRVKMIKERIWGV